MQLCLDRLTLILHVSFIVWSESFIADFMLFYFILFQRFTLAYVQVMPPGICILIKLSSTLEHFR